MEKPVMTAPSPAFEQRAFRDALGFFATGVTVITTADEQGRLGGLTSNSFNSLSLDPPLVLWSLAETSSNFGMFSGSSSFAVHILAQDQVDIANHFAQKGGDKFSGLTFDRGISGLPLLRGCAVTLQCRKIAMHKGGDHMIFIGQVLDFNVQDRPVLAYHRGRYVQNI